MEHQSHHSKNNSDHHLNDNLKNQSRYKSVFITGGTSGLGEGLALEYLLRGAVVGICARSSSKWLQSELYHFVKARDLLDKQFYFYELDITNREKTIQVVKDFAHTLKEKGLGLELVIANAGIGNPKKESYPNFEVSEEIFKINTLGTLYTAEAAFSVMHPQQSGHLVLMSSIAGKVGLATNGAYCASKASVLAMAESFHQDWQSFGIFVSVLLPGFIDTPMTRKNNHPMPYLLNRPRAIRRMIKSIERRKFYDIFPWPLAALVTFMSMVPKNLFVKIAPWMTFYRINKNKKENHR